MKKIIILLLVSIATYAQDTEDNGVRIILKTSLGEMDDARFYVYDSPFQAKAIYKDTIAAENNYPEELMSSIMSEDSEAWHNYNNVKAGRISNEMRERFKKVSTMNKEKNYFELLHKFSFELEGQNYCIIKFNLVTDEKENPIRGAYSMIKKNNKWKKTSSPQTFKMTMLNVFFKTERLAELFRGEKTSNELTNQLIDLVYENGILKMDNLLNEFESWNKNNNVQYLEYFTQKPNWNE